MSSAASPWWELDGEQMAKEVASTVNAIRAGSSHTRHLNRLRVHRRLYEAAWADAMKIPPGVISAVADTIGARDLGASTVNVLRSCVDTAVAQIAARNRPRASLITSGGTWAERDRAKRANRLIDAVLRAGKAHQVALRAYRDALVDDCGFVRVDAEDGRVKFRRVDARSVCVQAYDGRDEAPQCMYLSTIVDRDSLASMHSRSPKLRALIKMSSPVTYDQNDPEEWLDEESRVSGGVRLYEAWRLPTCDDEPGRHVVCTDRAVICDEPWTSERFPIVAMRWESRPSGYWGHSLAEELEALQHRITEMWTRIATQIDRCAVPRVFVSDDNMKTRMDRTVGQIIHYRGTQPPVVTVGQAVAPESLAHLADAIAKAYEISGISRMQATAQKPAGLSSGEALREYNDLAADRAMKKSRDWEEFWLSLVDATIDALARCAEHESGEGEYISSERGAATLRLKWSQVALDRSDYILESHPTSLLARDFGTRKQQVAELTQAGLIDADTAARLLELPDIDRELDLKNAPRDIVEKQIEEMLDTGRPIPPDPHQDLAFAVRRGLQHIALEELGGADIDSPGLNALRTYVAACQQMLDTAAAAAAPQAPMQAPAPMPQAPMSAPPIA